MIICSGVALINSGCIVCRLGTKLSYSTIRIAQEGFPFIVWGSAMYHQTGTWLSCC
jgi:hypothetical protein